MNAMSWIGSLADRAIEARRRRHTERLLEHLPEHIKRDIGWPERRNPQFRF